MTPNIEYFPPRLALDPILNSGTTSSMIEFSEQFFTNIINSSDQAIVSKSLDGKVLSWNPAAERIFGYTAQEMIGQPMLTVFPADRMNEEDLILERIRQGEHVNHFKTQRLHKSGRLIDVLATISPIHDAEGCVIGASKIAIDITEKVRIERQIEQYKAMVDFSEDAIISKSLEGIILTWNRAAERVFGFTAQEAIGRSIEIIFPKERIGEEIKLLKQVRSGKPVQHFRTTRLRKDGERIFVSVSISAIYNAAGELTGYSKIVRDLTAEVLQEQSAWKGVHYDALTGLMNRTGAQIAVDDLIQVSQVRNRKLALISLEVCDFNEYVKRLGIQFADRLIIQMARQIKGCIRQADDAARIIGDRFLIILQGFTDLGSIKHTTEKIRRDIESIDRIGDQAVDLKVAIGVALYPEDGKNYSVLAARAEQARERFKASGVAVNYFSAMTEVELPQNFFLVQALQSAIEQNQLRLVYQPIIDLKTQQIQKAEALIRWRDEQLGEVSPAVFIPLAEKYGLIQKISRWVMHQAMSDLQEWTQIYGLDFQVSINLSSYDLDDVETCTREMQDALHQYGLLGSNLIIEVTESSLIGNPHIAEQVLQSYRKLGLQVALDDFGTGYSSLEYLKRYPVDIIKIDRSFVSALDSNQRDYHLCEGIIRIAENLGLKIVAEGVEQAEVIKVLEQLGAEFIQGYYYSKPLERAPFADYLRAAVA